MTRHARLSALAQPLLTSRWATRAPADGMEMVGESVVDGQGRRARLLTVLAAAGAVLAGVGAATWYGAPRGQAEARPRAARPPVGALLPLEPFIANLGDEGGTRYLRATLQVEFFADRVPDEFEARVPQIRDLVLTLFTSKLFAEIRTPQGKTLLREEIVARMNRTVQRDVVKAVYFTEFIVQ